MAEVQLKNIYKIYDGNPKPSVTDFNLDIKDKEFIVFVGPSGCGKSTTLRMIAGLEEISRGELIIDGTLMNDVAPKDRDIAMVFQSYALYPHMNVYDNMAFGLKLRKMPKAEIDQKVRDAAKILGLEEYLERKPKALSGGQRQRVALGRAIVRHAKVFLMDEPLSNLDAKLRVSMRSEIIKLHERLATTTIYVTHDQTEAMTMASRIVVMRDGLIEQIGTPKEIYNTPATVFVGGFTGSPAMNFLEGKIENGHFVVSTGKLKIPEGKNKVLVEKGYDGKDIIFGIRPENLSNDPLIAEVHSEAKYNAEVEVSELLGHELIVYTKIGGQQVIAKLDARNEVAMNDQIELAIDMNKCHFFDKETEQAIR